MEKKRYLLKFPFCIINKVKFHILIDHFISYFVSRLFHVIGYFSIYIVIFLLLILGFPGGASGKEPACQCWRHKKHGFDPWVRKIPWRRAWQPTLVFLPGESHGQRSLNGLQSMELQSQTRMKWLSVHALHQALGKFGGEEESWYLEGRVHLGVFPKSRPLRPTELDSAAMWIPTRALIHDVLPSPTGWGFHSLAFCILVSSFFSLSPCSARIICFYEIIAIGFFSFSGHISWLVLPILVLAERIAQGSQH